MGIIDGKSKAYEDKSFTSGESPRILDVFSDLARDGITGYITNDGNGDIYFAISGDGVNYGDNHTLKAGETLQLEDMSINKIRLTYISNTSYRVYVA